MFDATDAPIILDVLLSDVGSSDLHERLSKKLNKKYLSDTAQELDNVEGILFGDSQRLFGTMTLNIKKKIKNVHFLVNTGSPRTYICDEVLKSYNLFISDPNDPFIVRLNQRQISVKVSHDHFEELNILGTDFLHTNKAILFVDFEEKRFTIKFRTFDSIDNSESTPGVWYQGLENHLKLLFSLQIFLSLLFLLLIITWMEVMKKNKRKLLKDEKMLNQKGEYWSLKLH
jgi:hypothetical protein